MEGVKRVNTVELNIPTGAGSLWDKVQNKLGQWTAGQPMDKDLQKDLIKVADMLEKNGYKKYRDSHQSITKRYQLTDEQPLPEPVGSPTSFKEGNAVYDIPGDKVEAFRKAHPNAQEQ